MNAKKSISYFLIASFLIITPLSLESAEANAAEVPAVTAMTTPVSAQLTVNSVNDVDQFISGTGIPGHYVSILDITQNKSVANNILVDENGNYSYQVTPDQALEVGDEITVHDSQVSGGLQVSTTVIGTEDPVITGESVTEINPGSTFDPMDTMKATDKEDGDLTGQIVVTSNPVDTSQPGNYDVVYAVTDSHGNTTTFTREVIVTEAPTITGEKNTTVDANADFDPRVGMQANDKEDGDITSLIDVTQNDVDTSKAGDYEVIYQVTDSDGNTTTFTREVTVLEAPVIVDDGTGNNGTAASDDTTNSEIISDGTTTQETQRGTTVAEGSVNVAPTTDTTTTTAQSGATKTETTTPQKTATVNQEVAAADNNTTQTSDTTQQTTVKAASDQDESMSALSEPEETLPVTTGKRRHVIIPGAGLITIAYRLLRRN
ncbi:DUF5011 domain-containing protein [Listeria sp. FSL L7-1582]|uniref:immunoglobulin-like domain-containing protein n=1 Tax=Listeria portnoyi TaxID=2713504 RepID=UPI00164D8A53|nr:immunoglobulin-like domain-containing protein [Listeria portnoyi]MBC6310366.1 DUF5011 domain-containing protein [Listeria portnoyi]